VKDPFVTLLTLPSVLDVRYRIFYIEKKIGLHSLNRDLVIVALDDRGVELGRTSYLVQGG
jgi:hypothetical protein